MIIGVTGYFASGKDTVAEYLIDAHGFAHLSLSDMIRRRLREHNREVTLENLTAEGNAIRRSRGDGALGRLAAESIHPGESTVVTSIRHPAEVEALRSAGDFILAFVDAPIEQRYQRSLTRARAGDYESFEAFAEAEDRQRQGVDSSAQRLDDVRRMADVVIDNDGSLAQLRQRVDEMLANREAPRS